jgi:osmoprotectant transport system permease protein
MLVRMIEYIMENPRGFTTALSQHLTLTFIALSMSVILGVGVGIVSTRLRWLRILALTTGNLGRTVPSLAVLALALPFLGVGAPPTILALVFIGTLPVLVNVIIGILQVDDFVIESARGMGMNDLQILFKVELPIAMPVVMAGVRTSAVLVVADATLAAFIGGGGLGDLILRGHALYEDHIVLAGALPAALLAFYFEETFRRLEVWATPRGLKVDEHNSQDQQGSLFTLLASLLVMPLVLGTFLPWDTFSDAAGRVAIDTGIHPAYSAIGVPVLVIGLIVALGPRQVRGKEYLILRIVILVMSLLAVLWLGVGLARTVSGLPIGHTLQLGIYVQAGAAVAIAVVAVLEQVWDRGPIWPISSRK